MSNPLSNFIEPILNVLPPQKAENFKGMVDTYAKVLEEFSDETLELAAQTMIRTMTFKSMPMPVECIKACREAQKTLALRRHRDASKRKPIPKQVMWTEEDAKRADQLFASHWGQRAVDDGVEIALWDFLVQQKRWPNNNEYSDLKAKSLARQQDLREFLKYHKENGGIKPVAKGWLKTMRTKSDKLKGLINECGEDHGASA